MTTNPLCIAPDAYPHTLADLKEFWETMDPERMPNIAIGKSMCVVCRLYLRPDQVCPICFSCVPNEATDSTNRIISR